MIYAIRDIDTHKHSIVMKTQIFKEAPPNLSILPDALNFFGFAAKLAGYKWTASVFDLESLDMLMKYEEELPFIKVACREDLYWIIGEIKRKIPVYVSINCKDEGLVGYIDVDNLDVILWCIPEYPAKLEEYYIHGQAYSDHTVGFDLWNKYKPKIIEWHYREKDSTGPDAGPFAKTVDDLREIL
jgi:hypothetical protein